MNIDTPQPFPKFGGFSRRLGVTFLGPAMVLLAFGQATGELIHWPYLVSKYGTYFVFILIPACVLQLPMFYFLARHTLLTGETYLSVLLKVNKAFALFTAVVFVLTSVWISSYTASGGLAIMQAFKSLTRSKMNVQAWANVLTIAISVCFFFLLLTARSTYRLISRTMTIVSIASSIVVTVVFIFQLTQTNLAGSFFRSILDFKASFPASWDPKDTRLLITAFVFVGLGGLWNMLYSVWLRGEKLGMCALNTDEFLDFRAKFNWPSSSEESRIEYLKAMKAVKSDLYIGTLLNVFSLLMFAFCAYSFTSGGMKVAANFGGVTNLGDAALQRSLLIGVLFYCFVGFFLLDTWLTAADALSKVYANVLLGCVQRKDDARETSEIKSRKTYVLWLVGMLFMTLITIVIHQPQALNYLNGVLSSFGAGVLVIGLFMNERVVRSRCGWAPANAGWGVILGFGGIVYLALAVFYCLH